MHVESVLRTLCRRNKLSCLLFSGLMLLVLKLRRFILPLSQREPNRDFSLTLSSDRSLTPEFATADESAAPISFLSTSFSSDFFSVAVSRLFICLLFLFSTGFGVDSCGICIRLRFERSSSSFGTILIVEDFLSELMLAST